MSVKEIQSAIVDLPPEELADLMEWIDDYQSDAWDLQIAQDVEAGRFDALRQRQRASLSGNVSTGGEGRL